MRNTQGNVLRVFREHRRRVVVNAVARRGTRIVTKMLLDYASVVVGVLRGTALSLFWWQEKQSARRRL